MSPSMRQSVVVPAPEKAGRTAIGNNGGEAAGGCGGASTEEQARAIISAAKRALEEEDAGLGLSSVVRSLGRFLEKRRKATAVGGWVRCHHDEDSSSSSSTTTFSS